MLKIVEYGLFAVSLLTVLGLIVSAPSAPPPSAPEPELEPLLPPGRQ